MELQPHQRDAQQTVIESSNCHSTHSTDTTPGTCQTHSLESRTKMHVSACGNCILLADKNHVYIMWMYVTYIYLKKKIGRPTLLTRFCIMHWVASRWHSNWTCSAELASNGWLHINLQCFPHTYRHGAPKITREWLNISLLDYNIAV